MLLPIITFLMVLSPLFIPMAVTVVHKLGNRRSERPIRQFGPVRGFRPAVGLVPAAA